MNKAKNIVKQSTDSMQKDADSINMKKSVSQDAEKQMLKVRNMMSNLQSMAKQPLIDSGVLVPTEEYTELSGKAEEARNELERLQTVQNNMNPSKAYQVSKDYEELEGCITQSKKALESLLSKQREWDAIGINDSFDTYRELKEQIEEAKNTLSAFEEEERNMRADGSSRVYSQEWQEIQRQIDAAKAKLSQFQSQQAGMRASGTDTSYAIKGLSNGSYLQMGGAIIKQQMSQAKSSAVETMAAIKAKIADTVQSIPYLGRAATEAAYIGSKAFKGMKSVLSSIGPAIKKASGVFGSLIQKLKNGLPSIHRFGNGLKQTGRSASGFGAGLGQIARTAKFMLVSMAIMSGFAAMKEGFGNLAGYSSRANANLSTLMNSLTQLKNSLAAAFAPILNVVTPILDTFIGYLVGAINAVGQFFAAITGQSTYIKASKGTADFASSLGGVASGADAAAGATEKAESAAEKYKKSLMGFDRINALNAPDESHGNGSGGGAGGGSGGGDMFQTENVSSGIKNLSQMIKDAWASADFTEIGAMVGEKLNEALEKIPWEKIQSTCNKIAKSVATFLNGFIEATDWSLVGWTLSEGLNTAFEMANTFAVNFHWDSLGKAAGDGINGALGNLDWTLIRETVRNITNGVATTLNSFMKTTDWKLAGNSFGQGINTAIDIGYTFVTAFEWKKFGTAISESINGTIRTVDFSKAGKTLSESVKGVLDSALTAIENTDWKQLGEKVKEFIVNIDWSGIVNRISELIGASIGGLAAFVGGLIGDAFVAAQDYFSDKIDECGGNIVLGLLKGIGDALIGIGKWILDNIFTPIIEGFKSAFGINSPSTVMKEQGGYIISGLLEGLKENIASIIEWFKDLPEKFKEALGKVEDVIEVGISLAKNGWNTVSDWVKGFIGSALSAVVNLTGKLVGGAWETIKTVTSNLQKAAKKKVYEFTAKAKGDWKTLKSHVKNIVAKIKDKTANFTAKAKGAWDSLTSKAKELLRNIRNKSATYRASSSGPWSTIARNARETFNNVKSKTATFRAVASGAWDRISGVLGQAKKWLVNKVISWRITIPHIKVPHLSYGSKKVSVFGKKFDVPTIDVHWYAQGGFPEEGPFFMNRGEIAGKFGNGKGVVANNQQITAGIANAVGPAVYEAVVAAMRASGNGGSPSFNIYIGNKRIVDYFVEYVKKETKSTGKNPVYV